MNRLEIIGYPLLIAAAVESLLGILLLSNVQRKSAINRSVAVFSFFTAAFSLITGLMYVLAGSGRDITPLARANWVGWLMIPAAIQFALYMRDENSKVARIVGYILYPFWIIVLAVSVSTDLIETGNYSLLPYADRSGPLGKPLRAFGVALLIWVMFEIYRLRRTVGGYKRAQLNYFTSGMLIFVIGGTLIAGVLPLVSGLALEPGLGSYFGLPWVIATYYAITRHRLFDLRLAASKAIAVLLLSILFAAVHVGLFTLFEPALGSVLSILLSLFLVGSIFFGTSFSRTLQHGVQVLVLQDSYDYQHILKDSTRTMVSILDLDELLTYIIGSINKSLETEDVCLFLKGADGRYTLRVGDGLYVETALIRPMDDALISAMQKAGRAVIPRELRNALPPDEFDRLDAYAKAIGAEAIIPMISKGEVQGLLTLGPKGNGTAYVQSDFDLLEAMADHAAVAIENARLYEEVRRAETSIKENQARLQNLIETTSDWVWEVDDRGVYTYVSPQIRDILGYEPGEVLGKTFFDFMPAEEARRAADFFTAMTRQQKPFRVFQNTNLHKDGSRVVVETSGVPYFDHGGRLRGYRGIDRDVTERTNLEKQLRRSQKMEAIGMFAGGVAHDFNNILTAIVGYANLIQMNLDKHDPEQQNVDQILSSAERAATLIQSLLAFGKKQVYNLRPANVGDIVKRMESLLAGLVHSGVELRFSRGSNVPHVLADCSQLERVIINLVVNARDAMPNGGILDVRTGTADVDGAFMNAHGFGAPGRYAMLTVQDTGTGMDEKTMSKIFEPFFTTKSADKGTGFGLSLSYEIVKHHNGYITVSSAPGKGSSFSVYLPVATEKFLPVKYELAEVPAGGSETVLVVDDEDDVRKYTRAVLEGFGYTVLEAVDGEDAVERFSEHRDAIQLLVMDVIMPKMGGMDAWDAIRQLKPGVKVLFTSGYPEDVIHKKGIKSHAMNFVIKPVSPKDLLRKVREVMAAVAPAAA